MNKKIHKEYNAVKMMREIRDQLSKEYIQHPEKEIKDLIEVRQRYQIKSKAEIAL